MKLTHARVVDMSEIPAGKAYLGATLELKNPDSGETVRYTLVAVDEADFAQGKISVSSPLGKGLLGKAEKEKVEIQVPAGKLKFEILKITR